MVHIKPTFFCFFILMLGACASPPAKEKPAPKKVSEEVLQLVQFMADSAATCEVWLSQDYKVRRFFTENDSLSDYLSNYFDHDQIVSWYQSIDTTTMLDLSQYLYNLDVPFITTIDSLNSGCASAINAIAFSHENKEALILFVEMDIDSTKTYTFLLERPDKAWYVADTLNVEKRARL